MNIAPHQARSSWRLHYSFLSTFYLTTFTTSVFSYYPIAFDSLLSSSLFIYYFIGETIGSLFFGLVRDFTSSKSSLLACFVLLVFSGILCLIQFFFGVFEYFSLVSLIYLLSGICRGGVAVVQYAYISEVVSDIDKLRVLSEITVAWLIGNTLSVIFVEAIQEFSSLFAGVFGGCLVGAGLVSFFVTLFGFVEYTEEKRVNRTVSYKEYSRPAPLGTFICFFYSIVLNYSKSIQEIMILEETKKTVTNQLLEMFLTGLGMWIIVFLCDKVKARAILLTFSVVVVVGWVFLIDFQVDTRILYYIGLTLTMIGFIITRCSTLVLLSTIIGPYPAGLYMGILITLSSLGSILGILSFPYTFPISSFLTQCLICLLTTLSLITLLVFWKHCKAHIHNTKTNKVIIELSCDLTQQPLILNTDCSYASAK